ncbi:MAG TPA: TfoX/Sxy family protein [Alphaproteobacteria bacterium]|nr:TfoX/Sxy family protein [Alphaproteobacteria bacterium]
MADKKTVMENFVALLVPLGPARAKPMFGGYGIFLDDGMFAKISSKGVLALKADDENLPAFEAAGMPKAGKMPYYEVQPADLEDGVKILAWARSSVEAASRQSKGKGKKKKK